MEGEGFEPSITYVKCIAYTTCVRLKCIALTTRPSLRFSELWGSELFHLCSMTGTSSVLKEEGDYEVQRNAGGNIRLMGFSHPV